jgi:hypothetical protein
LISVEEEEDEGCLREMEVFIALEAAVEEEDLED